MKSAFLCKGGGAGDEKAILKIVVDVWMTAALLFLMTYNMLGDAFHEWLGADMLVLFLLHHILNFKWSRAVFRGKYTTYRILQAYTDITDVTEELLHTLVEKIVVHEKEVIDGEIIMKVDIYYRFIGNVGDEHGEALKAPRIRRNTKLLMEAGVL